MNNVFKALSDPTRRHVLQLLRERPMTAGELADHFDVSRPTMSAHFAVLRAADLIDATKQGASITYRLKLSGTRRGTLGVRGYGRARHRASHQEAPAPA